MNSNQDSDELVEIAEQMIHSNRLPEELEDRLRRVADLTARVGGRCQSRQVAALVIAEWEREGGIRL